MKKNWYNERFAFLSPERASTDNHILSTGTKSNLSPLTNFILNTFEKTNFSHHVVISTPSQNLNPIPLIAFLYMNSLSKSVIALANQTSFDDESPAKLYEKNYYLLAFNNGIPYVFERFPCGSLSNKKVDVKPFLPRAKPGIKRQYIDKIKRDFSNSKTPRFLICGSRNTASLNGIIETLVEGSTQDSLNIKINVGLIIIENADRFFNSMKGLRIFLNWIKPFADLGAKFVIHFSNPNSEFIRVVDKEMDAVVLNFGYPLIKHNSEIVKQWSDYRQPYSYDDKKKEKIALDKFNWDTESLYDYSPIIKIWKELPPGNLERHYNKFREIMKDTIVRKLKKKEQFRFLCNVGYNMPRISMDLRHYKTLFPIEAGYRYRSIDTILEYYNSFLDENEGEYDYVVEGLLTEIASMFDDIKSRLRYDLRSHKSATSKYKSLIEFLETGDVSDSLVICVNSAFERNWLSRDPLIAEHIDKSINEREIRIIDIRNLKRVNFDRSRFSILFMFDMMPSDFSEILRTYNNIYYICYSGREANYINKSKEIQAHSSLFLEKYSIDSMRKLLTILKGNPKDPIILDFEKRVKLFEKINGVDDIDKETGDDVLVDKEEFIGKILGNFGAEILENYEPLERVEKEVNDLKVEAVNEGNSVEMKVKNLYSQETKTIKLIPSKIYMFLKSSDTTKILDGYPKSLQPGNMLILPEDNVRSDFVDILFELKGIDAIIDKDMIHEWHEVLTEHLEKNDFDAAKFWLVYKKLGGDKKLGTIENWIAGSVVGPRDYQDLKILTLLSGSVELHETRKIIYGEMQRWRTYRRQAGRKISKVIKVIIGKDISVKTDLGFEENVILQMIEKSIYQVL